jgi:GxxExxY protein
MTLILRMNADIFSHRNTILENKKKNAMLLHEEITQEIIRCFFRVYNYLGYGFMEKVYENAMCIELAQTGLQVKAQEKIEVYYNEVVVGTYYADLLIEDKVIIEIKSVSHLLEEHEAQLLNYLKATSIEVGLLLNFGEKAEFKRRAFSNYRK